jgi:hypothetical protein
MTNDVRVGVIGVGMIGADHAARLVHRIVGASLTAVSDPDAAHAEDLAGRFDGVRSPGDAADLVASDDVDAVLIASPGFVHEEQVLAFIEHGKPVLYEKPLTMDAASSLRLAEPRPGPAVFVRSDNHYGGYIPLDTGKPVRSSSPTGHWREPAGEAGSRPLHVADHSDARAPRARR